MKLAKFWFTALSSSAFGTVGELERLNTPMSHSEYTMHWCNGQQGGLVRHSISMMQRHEDYQSYGHGHSERIKLFTNLIHKGVRSRFFELISGAAMV